MKRDTYARNNGDMRFAELPQLLAKMRNDPDAWEEMAYRAGGENEERAQTRYACLAALQFDHEPDDRALIVYLLDQEIAWRKVVDGCGRGLELAVFLTATLGDPALALHIQAAKDANFDAGSTIDIEAVYCCGIDRTLQMFADMSPSGRADSFPPDMPTQAEVNDWWHRQRKRFPAILDDERDKAGICEDIGDLVAASGYFRQDLSEDLDNVEPGSAEERRVLIGATYRWQHLGRPDEAVIIQRQLDLQTGDTPWERASDLSRAVEIYVAAGSYSEAATKIEPLRTALLEVQGWHTVGLGRGAAGVMADFAIATPDTTDASKTFLILEALMAYGLAAPPILLAKLATLATRVGRPDRTEYYESLNGPRPIGFAAPRGASSSD